VAIFRDRHISIVKQFVKVRPQEEAVGYLMRTFVGVGANVCGLQHRQCPFTGNGTFPVIGVRYQYTKRSLTQPHPREEGRAIPFRFGLGCYRPLCHAKSGRHFEPEVLPDAFGRVVGLPPHGVCWPACRGGNPFGILKEEGLAEKIAPDLWVGSHGAAEMGDAFAKGGVVPDSIPFAEGLPGKPRGQDAKANEETTPDDEIFRGMELEQENDAWLEKICGDRRRGLPEIDLLRALLPKLSKPVLVSHTYPEAHATTPLCIPFRS
jgi:hypothetical protein